MTVLISTVIQCFMVESESCIVVGIVHGRFRHGMVD